MPDDEGLRRLLAEALPEMLQPVGVRFRWSFGGSEPLTGYGQMVIDPLLPVVERYAARRAAEALRGAADLCGRAPVIRAMLCAHADALRDDR